MSFQIQTATTFVRLRLTDLGRQKMAQGIFGMSQVVFSDREVNYAFNRRYPDKFEYANTNPFSNHLYDIENNKIMSPGFAAAGLPLKNFDGTAAYDISDSVITSTQILTAATESKGIWSAITSGTPQQIGHYRLDAAKYRTSGYTVSNEIDNRSFGYSAGQPLKDELLYMRFRPPVATNPDTDSDAPLYAQWYRVTDSQSGGDIFVDRETPDFTNVGTVEQYHYSYPFSATTDYWNSGTTPGDVWSLSIVRTNAVIGTTTNMIANGSGYTSYASKEFSGTKRFFGFDSQVRAVGFVWHQDKYTGSTYGDLFMPGSTQLDLPDVMWHRKLGVLPGQATKAGHRFVDSGSKVFYDEASKANYTGLYDGTDPNRVEVGRVYYELKLIVITDQELLTVMSYKSNRNYTLPKLKVELSDYHEDGFDGVVSDGNTYYFTYYIYDIGSYSSGRGYGYRQNLPCANWTQVDGLNSPAGSPLFPTVSLDPSGFPYMRLDGEAVSMSGTGWQGERFQIMMASLDNNESGATGVDLVRPSQWGVVSDATSNAQQNGVYVPGSDSNFTIDPNFMGTRMFKFHSRDIAGFAFDISGNTPNFVIPGEMTSDTLTGLTWGSELFLNGNVKNAFGLRTEKLVATVSVDKNELNASLTGGFKGSKDLHTYVTEVGVFNEAGELMAVGKPTYPVRKNSSRHLLFQLEIDI